MTEIERISKLLQRTFEGKAWHGPSLEEVLIGVTAQAAARQPPGGAHSIWQIVLHATTWKAAVARWLDGDRNRPGEEENWPLIADTSEAAWQETLARLRAAHGQLRDAVSRLDDARLSERLFDDMPSVYTTLHGVIHHDLYHAGQIALLKKICG